MNTELSIADHIDKMAIDDSESSNSSTQIHMEYEVMVNDIMTTYFPHYGKFVYIPINTKNGSYKCSFLLFGMTQTMPEEYKEWNAAKEAAAKHVFNVLTKLLNRLQGNDKLFGKLFTEITDDLKAFKMAPSYIDKLEQQITQHGHSRIVSISKHDHVQKETASRAMMGDLITGITNKINNQSSAIQTNQHTKGAEIDQSNASKSTDTLQEENLNPISFLYQHWQKNKKENAEPTCEYHEKGSFFGATGTYMGHLVNVRIAYRKKVDCKWECFRLLAEKVVGDLVTFAEIKPDPRSGGGEFSRDQLEMKVEEKAPTSTESKLTALKELVERMPKAPFSALKPPRGKNFVSIVNEYCQKKKLDLPLYESVNLNSTINNLFCSRINFDGLEWISSPFVKKSESRDDVAGRIFQHLLKERKITEEGRVVLEKRSYPLPPAQQVFRDRAPMLRERDFKRGYDQSDRRRSDSRDYARSSSRYNDDSPYYERHDYYHRRHSSRDHRYWDRTDDGGRSRHNENVSPPPPPKHAKK